MKKRLLLGLLPAILALSSCTSLGAAGTVVKGADLYVEDTLAHEETFENAGLLPRRSLDPVYSPDTDISIGVQYSSPTDGKVSMRFIAAIKVDGADAETRKAALSHTTAVWTRSVYNESGTKILTEREPEVVATKAYDEINSGGVELKIGDYGDHSYSFFVAYTMRNIPVATTSYLNVSLSVRDSENDSFNKDSKVIAASVDGNTKFAFNRADSEYVLIKKSGSSFTSYPNDASHPGNLAAFTSDVSVNEGDAFVIANIWSTGFSVYGYNSKNGKAEDVLKDKVRFYNVGSSNLIYSNYKSTDFKVYLNTDSEMWINSGVNLTKTIYLNATNWDPSGAKLALYVFNNSNTAQNQWFKFAATGVANEYSTSISVPYSWLVNVIFCRYNKADDDPCWDPKNVYNQTGDLDLHTYKPSNLYTPTSWDGDNGNTAGTWSIK